jgi:hypothetical protein
MSQVIQRVPDPELFFGIVAPIGTNVEPTIEAIQERLVHFGYKPALIRLTKFFPKLQDHLNLAKGLDEDFLERRYHTYIGFGDALRKKFRDDSFLGAVAVNSIVQKRGRSKTTDPEERDWPQKQAYIVRQFKRREEVQFLRSVYGRLFFQVSIYSKRSSRVDNLARKIASSHNSADPMRYRDEAEKLVRTDENEIDAACKRRISRGRFHRQHGPASSLGKGASRAVH